MRSPSATSTSTISYQGRLADTGGNPLTGQYNMEFRIYDVPTGSTPLWEEDWTAENSVQVSDGLFNVMLGSINNTLPSAIAGHDELYLGIAVGTDSEMSPRVQLGSVPFSMQASDADTVDGWHASDLAAANHTHNTLTATDGNPVDALYVDDEGKVGIGTTSPGAELEVAGNLKLAFSNTTCTATRAGSMRYNSNENTFEGCDGEKWQRLSLSGTDDGSSQEYSGTTCQTILANNPSTAWQNGIYWIDPNGGDHSDAFPVYCDMTTDNGGWTYIANISDSDADIWSQFYPAQDAGVWSNASTVGSEITFTGDYKSRAYNEVEGTSLLIKEGQINVLIAQNCWAEETFRGFISSLTWNADGSDSNWQDNSGAYLCDYIDFGYNDPVLRASTQSNKEIGFKWGERDGVQDGNKDRTMITTDNANGHAHHVDRPTGLGGFTSYNANENYEDANECQGDGPDQCSSLSNQNYQLFIR